MRTLCFVLGLASCTTAHVVVPPHPARTAPEAEREAYRDRFTKDPMRLADGTTLEDLGDIAPAVDDNTATADAARSASFDASVATAGAIGAAVGFNLGWIGLIASGVSQKDGEDTPASQFFLVASGVSAIAGVASLTAGIVLFMFQSDAEERARSTFAKDLDAALALPPRDAKSTRATTKSATTASATTTPSSTSTSPAAPTNVDAAATPTPVSTSPSSPPPPMHVVVREGATKIAEFDAGPDGALAPSFVDDARREIAGDVGGIFAVRGSALFACFMRSFPKPGTKQKASVHLVFTNGKVTSSKGSPCAAKALSRGSMPLSADSFAIDVDIEDTAGPFVSPRCRRAIGTNAFALSCKGLFPSPDAFEVVYSLAPDQKAALLAEGFHEDLGCKQCDVPAIEERYVRQLTDDDAIIKAAVDACR